MTLWIAAYIIGGAVFGLASFSHKHLFSEGPERRVEPGQRETMDGRVAWVVLCSALWPLMTLTGVYSFWRLRQQRVRARRGD